MFKNKLFLYGFGTGLIIASLLLQLASLANNKAESSELISNNEEIQWETIFLDQLDDISEAAQHHGYRLVKEQSETTTTSVYGNDEVDSLDDGLAEGGLLVEESPAEEVVLEILDGMGSVEVADLLEQLHLIEDREQFELAMASRVLTRRIQKGTYRFDSMPQLDELIKTITK